MKSLPLFFLVLALAAAPASADIITFSFSGSGTNLSNNAVSGTADFSFDTQTSLLTLSLNNSVQSLSALNQVLTDIEFTINADSLALQSMTAPNTVVCSNGACSTGAYVDGLYWSFIGTPSNGDFHFGANGGALHPYGIVSDSLTPNCGGGPQTGGLCNSEHNPYLLGPVDFTFLVSGLNGDINISDVTLSFGTEGFQVPTDGGGGGGVGNPVPEPSSLMLLGTGLLAAAGGIKRRLARR